MPAGGNISSHEVLRFDAPLTVAEAFTLVSLANVHGQEVKNGENNKHHPLWGLLHLHAQEVSDLHASWRRHSSPGC